MVGSLAHADAENAVNRYGALQDVWELTQMIHAVTPRLFGARILEIGCDRGGTLWLWSQYTSHVTAVTLHTRTDGQFDHHGAKVVVGDSTDVRTRARVMQHAPDDVFDFVFVDGGHDLETARADIAWACLIAPGGIVAVHDTNQRPGVPEIETWLVWPHFAGLYPHALIRRSMEDSPGVGLLYPGAVPAG